MDIDWRSWDRKIDTALGRDVSFISTLVACRIVGV